MRGIALVIDAVNVLLRRLGELPDGPEVSELRDRALACIEEVALWNAARPAIEKRDATMVRVLTLHVAVNRLANALERSALAAGEPSSGSPDSARPRGRELAAIPQPLSATVTSTVSSRPAAVRRISPPVGERPGKDEGGGRFLGTVTEPLPFVREREALRRLKWIGPDQKQREAGQKR